MYSLRNHVALNHCLWKRINWTEWARADTTDKMKEMLQNHHPPLMSGHVCCLWWLEGSGEEAISDSLLHNTLRVPGMDMHLWKRDWIRDQAGFKLCSVSEEREIMKPYIFITAEMYSSTDGHVFPTPNSLHLICRESSTFTITVNRDAFIQPKGKFTQTEWKQ